MKWMPAFQRRRPQPVIAGVLVGQNTNATAGTQQIDHGLKSLLAIEQFQASLATCPAHMRVNEAIAKFLIDTRIPHVADKLRHQLREQFPYSEMTSKRAPPERRREIPGPSLRYCQP